MVGVDGPVGAPGGEGEGPAHLLGELGFTMRGDGDALVGSARIVPQALVPDAAHLRTSVLATWADMLTGLLAARTTHPQVPVTLDLDIHLLRPAPAAGVVTGRSAVAKSGRAVFCATVAFDDDHGPLATGAGTFTLAPDRSLRMPDVTSLDAGPRQPTITVPLAERAGCRREAPGVAVQPRLADGLNSSQTVNGGLLALAAEEAALSLAPGATLASLHLRYLRPVRIGPARAAARVDGGLARIEITDDGADDRLAVLATARLFPADTASPPTTRGGKPCRPEA